MIVSGLDNTQICVGDIFHVASGESTLILQVTSPRKPCSYVDRKNGSPYGMKGLRRYALSHGLAGWFVRVLHGGEISDGMKLVRVENPHPKWTLEYVSRTLYGEGDRQHFLVCWAQWTRSKQELAELCALPAFGWYEWKAEAQRLLDRWGGGDVMVEPKKEDAPVQVAPSFFSDSVQVVSSRYTLPLSPTHLQSLCSHWVAVTVIGLAWLTIGLTVVTQDFQQEDP